MLETALTPDAFANLLTSYFHDDITHPIAVGVSGGADSLALVKLLSDWGRVDIHALTVDHGLRAESADEAKAVGQQIADFPRVTHSILTWQGDKPEARIQEEARNARYALMAKYCAQHGIEHLFLAHHADDQAETVLFRLAKGSGLDGLSGMRMMQSYDENLTLVRPILSIEKSRLVATCLHHGLDYIDDPSNFCDTYARPRLRAAREVLEGEGLSTKRLATTALRLQRARDALHGITDTIWTDVRLKPHNDQHVRLDWGALHRQPEEIGLRVVIKAIETLKPDRAYLPRMEKIESLFHDLRHEDSFRKRTLGGLVFERDDKAQIITVGLEA